MDIRTQMRPFKTDSDRSAIFYAVRVWFDSGYTYPDEAEEMDLNGERVLFFDAPELRDSCVIHDGSWLVIGRSGGYGSFRDEFFRMVFEVEL